MDHGWLRRAIETKRDGGTVEPDAWRRIIGGYVAGSIDAAPVAALAMACAIRGMADDEILALTDAMVASGEVLTFGGDRIIVDKHSSGGVGDAISLAVVPIVAACGIPVAKLSGRALGHTGGTLDKLEAVPGVRTDLAPGIFAAQVERIGCAIAAQSDRLVPADKMLYALRDRTGSVPSIGLIAASIVSKKIAGGAGAIVFDVKVGGGAFMRTHAEATALATLMVRLAERSGRRASAIVTDMDEPLSASVGTGLEVIEVRDFLRGVRDERGDVFRGDGAETGDVPRGDGDQSRFARLTAAIAAEMLRVGGVAETDVTARVERALRSGAAYERFATLIEAQGGDPRELETLTPARPLLAVTAQRSGFVAAIDAVAIGEAAREIVDRDGPFAGIRVRTPVGSPVSRGDVLAQVVGSADAAARVARAFAVTAEPPAARPLIAALIRDASVAPSSKTEGQ